MKYKNFLFYFVVSPVLLAGLVLLPLPRANAGRVYTARDLGGISKEAKEGGSLGANGPRGQFVPEALPPAVVFTGQLTPASEVPPVTNADAVAVGEAVVTLHVTLDSGGNITAARADFAVAVLGVPANDTIVLCHIHQGDAAVAGPVVVDSGISPGSPVTPLAGVAAFFRSNLAVSPSTAQALVANPAGFYFNVHTNANPGGAVRGQLAAVSTTTTPIVFVSLLLPSNEVPPVTGADATGAGLAIVALTPARDATGAVISATAQFDCVIAGLPPTDDIILCHIHQGAVTANGPVVVDSGLSPMNKLAVSPSGNLTFTVSGLAVPTGALQGMLTNPDGFYFNVHSNVNPGGAMRDQLNMVPFITGVTVSGKNLLVTGTGFRTGSVLLVGGQQANTKNDPANLSTSLIGKKALKLIAPGGSADVEVDNPNGLQSPSFIVSRP
jgi:hypothetical protein